MLRIASLAASCLALASCDQFGLASPPEVRACEAFTKDQLRSPSTFRIIKTVSNDTGKLTLPEFYKLIGAKPEKGSIYEQNDQLQVKQGLALRQLGFEYEASNAYGVPVKGYQVCAFRLIDGKLESESTLESNVSRAKLIDLTAQLGDSGYDTRELKKLRPPRGYFGCCL